MDQLNTAFAVGLGFNAINIVLIILIIYILFKLARVLRKLDNALDIWLNKNRNDHM